MKLKKLTMTAFGSYAGTETIDFESLAASLYLIRGNTGAGKTTIFDAIVFALYGASSGGHRTPAMMHSDFADPKTDLVVELEFEHQGGVHRVKRSQHFTRHRGTDDYTPATPSAEFWEAGEPVISGASKVTNRITELLGLNAGQFGQIVMLAQGDFKKFLESGNTERSKILSRIFDTTPYRNFTARLEKAESILRSRRASDEDSIRLEIQNLQLPDDIEPDVLLKLKPTDPNNPNQVLRAPTFVDDMTRQVASETVQAQDLRARHAVCHKVMETKLEESALAEHQNARLDALLVETRKQAGLVARADEMNAKKACLDRGARAWPVRCADVKVRQAQSDLGDAQQQVDAATGALANCKTALEDAQVALHAVEPLRAELNAARVELAKAQEGLPNYQRLSRMLEEQGVRSRKKESLLGQRHSQDATITTTHDQIVAYEAELKDLQAVDAEVASAEQAQDKTRQEYDEFTHVRQEAEGIQQDERQLSEARSQLQQLTGEAESAMADYHRLYSAFIAGQAGLMAEKLRQEIRASGAGVCPVCGVRHTDAQTDSFAVRSGIPCTEEDVKQAQTVQQTAEAARGAQETCVATLAAKIESSKKNLLGVAQRITRCAEWTWNDWCDAEKVSDCQLNLRKSIQQAETALGAAKARLSRRNRVQGLVADAKNDLEQLTVHRQETEDELHQTEIDLAADASVIDQLRKNLTFGTEADAQADIQSRQAHVTALDTKIKKADENLAAAREKLAAADASQRDARRACDEAGERLQTEKAAFGQALQTAGYVDEATYQVDAALLPVSDDEVHQWMADMNTAWATYQNDCKHVAESVAALKAETKDFVRRDLEATRQAYTAAKIAESEADERANRMEGFVQAHEALLKRIQAIELRLASSEKTMQDLSELASLATAARGMGNDRIDFERYMLGDCLKDVLGQANAHLDKMSGGRYTLVHRAAGANHQAVAGLDIDVRDRTTGKQRSADSISGGEGFEASMSLALGLADVVRNHAGNVQLDSTFIDEGFGSLDGEALEKCMEVLQELAHGANGGRQVGVISHVSGMEDRIWPQIQVSFSETTGSHAAIKLQP